MANNAVVPKRLIVLIVTSTKIKKTIKKSILTKKYQRENIRQPTSFSVLSPDTFSSSIILDSFGSGNEICGGTVPSMPRASSPSNGRTLQNTRILPWKDFKSKFLNSTKTQLSFLLKKNVYQHYQNFMKFRNDIEKNTCNSLKHN